MSHGFDDEVILGKAYDSKIMKRLLKYVLPHKKWVSISLITLLIFKTLALSTPFILKNVIDEAIVNNKISLDERYNILIFLTSMYVVIVIIRFINQYIHMLTTFIYGQKVVLRLRNDIYSHLQTQPLKYYDKNPVGRLMTRVMNDVASISQLLTAGVVTILGDLFMLIVIVGYMLYLNVTMTFITLGVLPPLFWATMYFKKHAREAYREIRLKVARLNAYMQESISGMKVIQMFAREKKNLETFGEANEKYKNTRLTAIHYMATYFPTIDFVGAVFKCLLIAYVAYQVFYGTIEIGVAVAFIMYVDYFFQPIREMGDKFNLLQQAMASSERIFGILDTKSDIVNKENPKSVEDPKGEIEFKDVWFEYVEGEPVLQGVSFKVLPGESVALVGATGAGKTSITNICTRFYDIKKGQLLVDGIDVRDWELKKLRSMFSIVLQDVFLFTDTVENNISLCREDITLEKVKEAAKHVNASKFIEKLEGDYQYEVTERGGTFSSGEKQLLAFARALAFDPKILVLDEATSSIDTETEQLIQDALEKLMKGRTSIIVAHRLSTIQHVDKIIVLHRGKIVEMGNHQELLAQKGYYYKLYQLQYKGQEDK